MGPGAATNLSGLGCAPPTTTVLFLRGHRGGWAPSDVGACAAALAAVGGEVLAGPNARRLALHRVRRERGSPPSHASQATKWRWEAACGSTRTWTLQCSRSWVGGWSTRASAATGARGWPGGRWRRRQVLWTSRSLLSWAAKRGRSACCAAWCAAAFAFIRINCEGADLVRGTTGACVGGESRSPNLA